MARRTVKRRDSFGDRQRAVWRAAVQRTVKTLREIEVYKPTNGETWALGMLAHYKRRLDDILKNAPPGCEPDATRLRARMPRMWRVL